MTDPAPPEPEPVSAELPPRDLEGEQLLDRALIGIAVLGVGAAAVALLTKGTEAARSLALGAFFAAVHLWSVSKSVRSLIDIASSPLARLFLLFRPIRFFLVLAAAALVLVAGLAAPLPFLLGYTLLVPAIVMAPFVGKRATISR